MATLHWTRIENIKKTICERTNILTSHLFIDSDWRNIHNIENEIRKVVYNKAAQYGVNLKFEIINVEYTNYDVQLMVNMTKSWQFAVSCDDEHLFNGYILAMAAGTVNDVWSRYDACVCL